MSKQTFNAQSLLQWYDGHQRILPWRAKMGETPNPYYVLLSEIMLQQTQVATVIPYFYRFIEHFPTLDRLASAKLDQVMSLWTGLGYYRRARNLHRCAQEIIQQGGEFPHTVKALKALSGIGDYTAAAVAAIAFNVPVVPIDGNVERLTARLFAIESVLPAAKKEIDQWAISLNKDKLAQQRAGDFAQALFDVGATLCKPKNPACLLCPLSKQCIGLQKGIAATLPRRAIKANKPVRYGVSFFIQDQKNRILFSKRPEKGVLAGTLELPSTVWEDHPISWHDAEKFIPYAGQWQEKGEITHIFTHFILKIRLYKMQKKLDLHYQRSHELWYPVESLKQYPFSSLMNKLVKLALD